MGFISLNLGLSLGSLASRDYFMSLVVCMGRYLLSVCYIFLFSFIFYILVIQELLNGIEIDQQQMLIIF